MPQRLTALEPTSMMRSRRVNGLRRSYAVVAHDSPTPPGSDARRRAAHHTSGQQRDGDYRKPLFSAQPGPSARPHKSPAKQSHRASPSRETAGHQPATPRRRQIHTVGSCTVTLAGTFARFQFGRVYREGLATAAGLGVARPAVPTGAAFETPSPPGADSETDRTRCDVG